MGDDDALVVAGRPERRQVAVAELDVFAVVDVELVVRGLRGVLVLLILPNTCKTSCEVRRDPSGVFLEKKSQDFLNPRLRI